MYPRLKLLQKLLADDGAIFISIDDTEISNLRLLMDEVFGANNFVTTVIWHKNYAPKSSAKFFRKTMTILQFMRRTKWHGFQICCRALRSRTKSIRIQTMIQEGYGDRIIYPHEIHTASDYIRSLVQAGE